MPVLGLPVAVVVRGSTDKVRFAHNSPTASTAPLAAFHPPPEDDGEIIQRLPTASLDDNAHSVTSITASLHTHWNTWTDSTPEAKPPPPPPSLPGVDGPFTKGNICRTENYITRPPLD